MEDEIAQNIIEALSSVCPIERIDVYQRAAIEKLVSRFKELGEAKDSTFYLSFTESIQVNILNDIVEQIKLDIIEKKIPYLYKKDEDKNDFECGVFSTIRLIQHRVHCICD